MSINFTVPRQKPNRQILRYNQYGLARRARDIALQDPRYHQPAFPIAAIG